MRTIVTAGLLLLGTAGWGLCGDGAAICQARVISPSSTGGNGAATLLSPDARAIHTQIQRLARTVGLARRELGRAIEDGTPTPPDLAEDAAGWLQLLDRLEYEARRLGGSQGPYLASKAAAVKQLAEDIVRHAGDATGVPQPGAGLPHVPAPTRRIATALQSPPNDDCTSAIPIGLETVTGETVTATNDGLDSCGNSGASSDVWFRFTAGESGPVAVSSAGSDFDTVLTVHRGCPEDPETERIACNDDMDGLQSGVSFDAVAGESYLIRVSGAANAAGSFVLTVGHTGRLIGSATDNVTGQPVTGTRISAFKHPGWLLTSTETAADGSYALEIPELTTATVYAVDDSDGYVDELFDDVPCVGPQGSAGCNIWAATSLDLTAPNSEVRADFGLEPSSGISGNAVDQATGEPLSDRMRVRVYDASGVEASSSFFDGPDFSLTDLPPGTYYATLASDAYETELFDDIPCPGSHCDPTSGTPILTRPGEVTRGVSFSPLRLGSISGFATERFSGTPVSKFQVYAFDESGEQAASAWSEQADGHYIIGGLHPGHYYLYFEGLGFEGVLYPEAACDGRPGFGCSLADGTVIDVPEAAPAVAGIDVTVVLEASIRGTVRNQATAQPLSGIRVQAWPDDIEVAKATAVTSASGRYTLDVRTAGSYRVAVADGVEFVEELYDDIPCPGSLFDGCDEQLATLVTVNHGRPAEGIDFDLDAGSTIAGVVADAVSAAPLACVPIVTRSDAGFTVSGTSAADGAYLLQGLPAGRYHVAADATTTHLGALYDGLPCATGPADGCNIRDGTPVTVAVGPPHTVPSIDLALVQKGAIAGRVTARDTGEALPGVEVAAWNEAGERAAQGLTGEDGSYTVTGLASGAYFVTADRLGEYLGELYDGEPCELEPPAGCPVSGGTPVAVELGHTSADVDLSLRRGASVEGGVTDFATGERVYGYVSAWLHGVRIDQAYSSTSGYRLQGLPEASIRLIFEPTSKYLGQVYDGVDCVSTWDCTPAAGTPVELVPGRTVTGIDFTPKRQGSIRGVITDNTTGAALPGIAVHVLQPGGQLVDSVSTSATGQYEIPYLLPGPYLVETSNDRGYLDEVFRDVPCPESCPHELAEPVHVDAAQETRHVDLSLDRLGIVRGRTFDAVTGEPLGNVRVAVFDTDGQQVAATTSAAGTYTIRDLPPGIYYVAALPQPHTSYVAELYDGMSCPENDVPACLAGATPLTLQLHTELDGVDLAMKRLGQIQGRVTGKVTGGPVYCNVSAYDAQTHTRIGRTTTVDGGYSIENLPWGTYYVLASWGVVPELYDGISCPGGLSVGCALETGTPVTVSAAAPDRDDVDLTVDVLGGISGEVHDAATGERLSARVELFDESGRSVDSDVGLSFRFPDLAPGSYTVAAANSGYTAQMYDGVPCTGQFTSGCDTSLGTPIEVALNSHSEIVIELPPMPSGRVRAVVVDRALEQPIPYTQVRFVNAEGSFVRSCYTEADGSCVADLAPGTHFATAAKTGYETQLYDGISCPGSCDATKGTPIVVTGGSTVEIGFRLSLSGPAVEGRVTTAAGAGVRFVIVDAWALDGAAWVASTLTGANGAYRLSLPAGSYLLSTDNGQGLIDEVYDDVQCPNGPAYEGLCDPARGDAVEVVSAPVTGVDFALEGSGTFFSDAFEDSGGLDSSAVTGRWWR